VIYSVLYTHSLVSHTPILEIILDLGTPGVGVEENSLKKCLKGVIRCAGWTRAPPGGLDLS
jgi:hypothetical protein